MERPSRKRRTPAALQDSIHGSELEQCVGSYKRGAARGLGARQATPAADSSQQDGSDADATGPDSEAEETEDAADASGASDDGSEDGDGGLLK